ncbi:DUF6957 family protein [Pseudomonas aeruginosa]|uniref:DUF6957 family protein n=1 Tax=Pseudomonas aeruginosa TaxID=287 RepID=UPI00356B316D
MHPDSHRVNPRKTSMTDDMSLFTHIRVEEKRGLQCSDEDAINYASYQNFHKPHCIVRDWQIVEVVNSPWIVESGLQPYVIYIRNVIFDTKKRYQGACFIRTSPLVTMLSDFIFESNNTVYVLLGPGICVYYSEKEIRH